MISAVAMLLTRTIFATPVVNNKQDDTAASDLTDAAASAAAITEMGSQSNRNAEGGYGDLSTKHSVNKRSFYDISCKGIYDKTIFARVDQICEDCYSLFRAAKLHTLCRYDSFFLARHSIILNRIMS